MHTRTRAQCILYNIIKITHAHLKARSLYESVSFFQINSLRGCFYCYEELLLMLLWDLISLTYMCHETLVSLLISRYKPMNRAPRHAVDYWWGTETSASETTLFGLSSLSPDRPKAPKAFLFYVSSEITSKFNKRLLYPFFLEYKKKRSDTKISLSIQLFVALFFFRVKFF